MKRVLSLLSLLVVAIGAWAQDSHWTVASHSTQPAGSTNVYAYFEPNVGNAYEDYEVAAFIDGECRGVAEVQTSNTGVSFFFIKVYGNYDNTDETGKEVTFKAYYKSANAEYDLTGNQTVTWEPQGTYGYPPSEGGFKFTLTVATDYQLADIEVGLGQSVNLLDYLTMTPENAQLPSNASWMVNDTLATIEGNTLTANKTTTGTTMYNLLINGQARARAFVNIVSYATAIDIVTEEFTVNKGEWGDLTQFMNNQYYTPEQVQQLAYQLTPASATDEVLWELKDDGLIEVNEREQGGFIYNPVAAGTTQIRPYVIKKDGTRLYPAGDKWITVNIVVAVESVNFVWNQSVFPCNVGDDIYQRLLKIVTVTPEDATNTSYHFELVNESDHVTLQLEDERIVALKAGTIMLRVVSDENPNLSDHIEVQIYDPLKQVSFAEDPLIIDRSLEMGDAKYAIEGNIIIEDTDRVQDGEVTITGVIEGGGVVLETGVSLGITTDELVKGEATVSVVMKWRDYSNYDGTDATLVWATGETQSFTVKVVSGLEGMDVNVVPDENDPTTGTITLTPVPEDADVEWDDITIDTSEDYDASWRGEDALTITPNGDGTYSYETNGIPGEYSFRVLNGEEMLGDPQWFVVPLKVELQSGWQWRTNAYGYVRKNDYSDESNSFESFFGASTIEARTYYDEVVNDPDWGFFGSLEVIEQNQMYKVNMKEAKTNYLYGGYYEEQTWVYLSPGWTWIPNPYFFNRSMTTVFSEAGETLTEGLVVLSKADGSVEWDGNQWVGDLEGFKRGQGYLVYNPTGDDLSIGLTQETYGYLEPADEFGSTQGAPAIGERIWQYDHSQFSSNMTVVATFDQLPNADQYSIGAFVDGECRGEGRYVDGRFFITVHLDGREQVSFRLYNTMTGEYFDVDQTVQSQMRIGSLKQPMQMTSQAVITGIQAVNGSDAALSGSEVYNQNGMRQQSLQHGMNIVRMSDGTVRKVMKK